MITEENRWEYHPEKKDLVTAPEAVLTFYDCFIIEDCQEKKVFLCQTESVQTLQQNRSDGKSNPGIYRGGETGRIRNAKKIRKPDGHGKFSP